MKVYRIKISSWTASFRYPNLISGYQPTLEVPPISTVLGLLNAAAGKYLEHSQLKIGCYFEFEAKATDLETIYQIGLVKDKKYPSNVVKSNVIKREFLYNCKLYIYLQDKYLVEFLKKPYYSLVLGRSGDLATVDSIEEIDLINNPMPRNIKGQIIPFLGNYLPGEIQALPQYFTNSIPRNNIGTMPYSVISCHSINTEAADIETYTDDIDEKEIDIYFHHLNFNFAPTELL
ncbi:MAG: type I-B CRISPR-associated protein Cas5 [Bacteroidetes bacterium]|nr:type I-B CRISPR-associated protein Cas5 [Bacteroidota bacterium]